MIGELDVRKAEERARKVLEEAEIVVFPSKHAVNAARDLLALAALARRLAHALNSVHAGTAYEPAELADAHRAGLLED